MPRHCLNDPRFLIVDEPTASLGPEERVRFWNLLSTLSGERIISLSTHIVSDVEATTLEIAIIARGRLVTHDKPEALLRACLPVPHRERVRANRFLIVLGLSVAAAFLFVPTQEAS